MTRRKLSVAIIGLIACVCVAAVALVMYSTEQQKKEIRDKFGSDVAKLCNEPGGGAADLVNLTDKDGTLQFLVLKSDGTYNDWHKKLPSELRATDKASLSAVVCLVSRSNTVEACPYYDPKDQTKTLFTINRVQPLIDMILLNPTTGARIAEVTIQGGQPDKCPDQAKGTKGSTITKSGRAITYNDFYTALTDFVKSTQGQ